MVEALRLHLLECEGDVAIEGWEEAKVEIRAERDKETIEVREIAGGLEITSDGDRGSGWSEKRLTTF